MSTDTDIDVVDDQEPETPAEPDDAATPEPEPALILGKFKSQEALAKAYQEAERALTAAKEDAARSAQLTSWLSEHEDDFADYLAGKSKPKDEPKGDEIPHYDPAWETMTQEDMAPTDRAGLAKYNRWLLSRTREIASNQKLRSFLTDPQAFIQELIDPVVGDLRKAQQQTSQERQEEAYWAAVEKAVLPHAAELFRAGKGSAKELNQETASEFGIKVLEGIQAVMPAFQANPQATMEMVVKAVKADMPTPNATKKPPKSGTKQAGVAPPAAPGELDLEAEARKLLDKGYSASEVRDRLMKMIE